MRITRSDEMILFCYIAIAAINLTNATWLRIFNWTILIGVSIFFIVLEIIKFAYRDNGE